MTTAECLRWEEAVRLVRRLYDDGDYRTSLLVACGCFLGLRIGDLLELSWRQLLPGGTLVLTERKTRKRRTVRVNGDLSAHAEACRVALGVTDLAQRCFLNRFGGPISRQMVNRHLKEVRDRYGLEIVNFSTHSLRKTFGRRVVEMAGPDSEMALVRLSEIFNHTSPMVTRRYLGLRQEELGQVYDSLGM